MAYYLWFGFIVDRNVAAKVIPEEVEKRRSLFWELLYLDARLVSFPKMPADVIADWTVSQSLSLGRPPSLCIQYMDCQRPSYYPDLYSFINNP